MHVLAILLLALGISMDSFAVSLSNSITLHRVAAVRLLWIPAIFGITQTTLAALGFLLGSFIGDILETFEGSITFAVLAIIGGEMILSAFKAQRKESAETMAHSARRNENVNAADHTSQIQDSTDSMPHPTRSKESTNSTSHTTHSAYAARISIATVLIEALATSLDAFAIGFMLRASNTNPFLACTVIALITFILSVAGIIIGKKAGMILGEKAKMFGGIVPIGIGVLSLVT